MECNDIIKSKHSRKEPLKNCYLEIINFTKADLSYVDFSNSTLSDVKFSKCDCIETV